MCLDLVEVDFLCKLNQGRKIRTGRNETDGWRSIAQNNLISIVVEWYQIIRSIDLDLMDKELWKVMILYYSTVRTSHRPLITMLNIQLSTLAAQKCTTLYTFSIFKRARRPSKWTPQVRKFSNFGLSGARLSRGHSENTMSSLFPKIPIIRVLMLKIRSHHRN
jgi:hypothetical protein